MARSIANQAVPQDVTKLVIGIMQCRVSDLTTLSSTTSQTGVTGTTTTLSSSDTLGSLGEASITMNVTEKPFDAGYPLKQYADIIEKAEVMIDVSLHEFYATATTVIQNACLEAVNSDTMYCCSVELVAEFAYGGTKSIWFPNCILVPKFDFKPGNDWAGFPVSFRAIRQTGAAASAPVMKVN